MPLTPLQDALDRTGGAFDNKLQQLTGIAQSVKAAQVRKQKMAQELQNKKDLIQFKSDVELQQQKEYYEEVTKPQKQAEAQAEYMSNLQDSFTNAQESIRELSNKVTNKRFDTLSKYNLGEFSYDTKAVQKDGKIQGYQPEIYFRGQQIGYDEFNNTLTSLKSFGDFLETLETSDLGTSRVEQREINGQQARVSYIGSDKVDDYISQIKSDEDFRYQEYLKYSQGNLVRPATKQEADKGVSGGKTPQTQSLPLVGTLKESLGGETSKTYTFNQDVSNFFGGDISGEFTVDFTSSISGVKDQINNNIREGLLPEGSEFSLDAFPSEVRQQIVSGNITDETLQKIPEISPPKKLLTS